MNRIDMMIIAARYDATLAPACRYQVCRAQRRWKYGRHNIYQPGYAAMPRPIPDNTRL